MDDGELMLYLLRHPSMEGSVATTADAIHVKWKDPVILMEELLELNNKGHKMYMKLKDDELYFSFSRSNTNINK